MWKIKHLFLNADAGQDAGGAGGETTTTGDNLLATGATTQGENDWLPEKFRITGEDGSIKVEDSARKLAESYTHLEKRLGAGDAPPKTVEEYAPTVEGEGFNWDEFKADPEMQGFLKSAHAKGITNDQMSFILGEYWQRAPELVGGASELDQEAATASLKEVWKTDAEFKQNIGLAFRAFNSLAEPADKDKINEIGNNPLVIRMLAKVGAEMQEDVPVGGEINAEEAQSIRDLMKSEAYTNPKHADHERVTSKIRAFYSRTYGNEIVG